MPDFNTWLSARLARRLVLPSQPRYQVEYCSHVTKGQVSKIAAFLVQNDDGGYS